MPDDDEPTCGDGYICHQCLDHWLSAVVRLIEEELADPEPSDALWSEIEQLADALDGPTLLLRALTLAATEHRRNVIANGTDVETRVN